MLNHHILDKYKALPVQVKCSLWFLVCSFLQKGISVITTPVFTRLLTTSEYGQYSVFDSWLKIVTIFVSLHLYSGVYVQGLVKYSDDRKVYSSSFQGLILTLTIIWTVIYLVFRDFWNQLFSLTTVQMLAMLIMIWGSSTFHLWASEQRVEYRYRNLVAVTLMVSLSKPLLGILFVMNAADKVTARILAIALVELIGYTGFFVVQMKRGKKFYSKKYWIHALSFNLPLIPHYLSQTVLNSADRIMIKKMIGDSEAGIYSVAYALSHIMTMFNTALLNTLRPWIYTKIKNRKTEDITKIAYMCIVGISFINLALIGFAPEAVFVFAPKEYHEAIWVVPPVAMSVVFVFCYDLFATFEFYFEKTSYVMVASSIGALLNVGLNYVFIDIYGYMAAAYTTLICYIVYVLAHYIIMRKVCDCYLDGVVVYKPSTLMMIYGLFLVAGFLMMMTYNYPVLRYSVLAAGLIIVTIKRKTIIKNVKEMMEIRKTKQKRV